MSLHQRREGQCYNSAELQGQGNCRQLYVNSRYLQAHTINLEDMLGICCLRMSKNYLEVFTKRYIAIIVSKEPVSKTESQRLALAK
jgi:hypothetical protein